MRNVNAFRLPLSGLLCAIAVIGCATEPVWRKPGAAQGEFDQIRYQCLQGSAIPPTYNAATQSVVTTNYDLFNACMGAHGWHLQ